MNITHVGTIEGQGNRLLRDISPWGPAVHVFNAGEGGERKPGREGSKGVRAERKAVVSWCELRDRREPIWKNEKRYRERKMG